MLGRCQGKKPSYLTNLRAKEPFFFFIKGTEAVMLEHVLFSEETLPHNKVFQQDAATSL